jgi:hypothetical protein
VEKEEEEEAEESQSANLKRKNDLNCVEHINKKTHMQQGSRKLKYN